MGLHYPPFTANKLYKIAHKYFVTVFIFIEHFTSTIATVQSEEEKRVLK